MSLFPTPGLGEAIVQELRRGSSDSSKLITALRKQGVTFTLPGFYKALRNLRHDNIAFLNHMSVSLNVHWLQKLETFASLAQHAYSDPLTGAGNILQLRDGDRVVYSFKNPVQADAFWNHTLYILFDALPELRHWYAYSSHHWFLLGRTEEELALMKFMKQHNIRYLFTSGHRTPLDRTVAKYFDGDAAQYHMREQPLFMKKSNPFGIVLNVLSDFVIEAVYDKSTSERIENFYRTHTEISPKAIAELHAAVTQKTKIKLVIAKNEKKAQKLVQMFQKNFYLGKTY